MTSDKAEKAATVTNNITPRSVIPFTGGAVIFIYAFFWPEGYGHWLGLIVRSFRQTAGF